MSLTSLVLIIPNLMYHCIALLCSSGVIDLACKAQMAKRREQQKKENGFNRCMWVLAIAVWGIFAGLSKCLLFLHCMLERLLRPKPSLPSSRQCELDVIVADTQHPITDAQGGERFWIVMNWMISFKILLLPSPITVIWVQSLSRNGMQ